MQRFAPVVLFVYNRPLHTKKTIDALRKNYHAAETELYVYVDGPKSDSSESQLVQIKKLREYVQTIKGFKKVHIIQNEKNLGLANAITTGITEVINKHGKMIAIDDDIVSAKGFLRYMNEALDLYENDENVGCIHAWNYALNTKGQKDSTFFLKGADCACWATWQRAWKLYNKNGEELLKLIIEKDLEYEFNRRNTHDYINMLKKQIAGKNDSWAIRWHASLFLKNIYCLHPTKSIIKNIGYDGSGTNCGYEYIKQKAVKKIKLKRIPVGDSEWFLEAYASYKPAQKNKFFQEIIRLYNRLFNYYLKKLFKINP